MTKIKELVAEINEAITHIPEQDIPDILARYELKLTRNKLDKLCKNHQNSEEEISDSKLIPFFRFLRKRFERIEGSNLVYFLQPFTRVSRICLAVAEVLSKHCKQPVYDLLMPPLKSEDFKTSKGTLRDLKLTEFVLSSDEQRTPIEVAMCLENVLTNPFLRHTCANKSLTIPESQLIINHSVQAAQIFKGIFYANLNSSVLNKQDSKSRIEALKSDMTSENYQITATYGDDGRSLLLALGINSLATLANFLISHVDKTEWKLFLNACEGKKFEALVWEDKKKREEADFISLIQSASYSPDEEGINRAILYCLTERYRRQREKQDAHNTTLDGWINYVSAGYVGGYNKESKLSAASVFQDFLLSETPLDKLDDYLERSEQQRHRGALKNSNTIGNAFSMFTAYATSCLGTLVEQAARLAPPAPAVSPTQSPP